MICPKELYRLHYDKKGDCKGALWDVDEAQGDSMLPWFRPLRAGTHMDLLMTWKLGTRALVCLAMLPVA